MFAVGYYHLMLLL